MSEIPDGIKSPADLDAKPFDTVLVKRPLTGDRWVLWVDRDMEWRLIDHDQEPRDNSLVYRIIGTARPEMKDITP